MKQALAAAAVALAVSGCASIFNGQVQTVTIQSVPDAATISVTNRAGEKVHTGSTPATLSLKRGAGYFKPETYTITFTKPGFESKQLVVTGTMSGWYIGNILFGGLIGMLAVDPVTGGMYIFPESVSGQLAAASAPTASLPATLQVVSLDSLSPAQRLAARPIESIAR
ncbi:MAG: hypothetical protein HY855_00315 [Burkholderiales bacterium]|nr:hypothetical protein [Burkholderiales bacterium]